MKPGSTLELIGQSGKSYAFDVYSTDTRFDPVAAVYVVTRSIVLSSRTLHRAIYIGETDDVSEATDDLIAANLFQQYDADCVCLHADEDESSRRAKRLDLIATQIPICLN